MTEAAETARPDADFDESGWFTDDGAALRRFLVMRDRRRKKPVTADQLLRYLRRAVRQDGLRISMFPLGEDLVRQEVDEYLYRRVMAGVGAHAYNNDVQILNALARFCGLEVKWDHERPPPSTHKVMADERLVRLRGYKHAVREVHLRRRAYIHLELVVGARISEIWKIREHDLNLSDPDEPRVLIRHPAKRGKRRELPLPPSMLARNRPFGAWLRSRPIAGGDEGALWTTSQRPRGGARRGNKSGGPVRVMSQAMFAKEIRTIGEELGFRLNCTIMRHTVATRLLREHGFDVTYVQYWLGHAEIKSTMVYVRVSYEDVREALRRSQGVDLFGGGRQKKRRKG